MKLYFMKQKVIDDLKENMLTLHTNYFKFNTNDWILNRYDFDPFEFFMEVPDFDLAIIDDRSMGEIELENCKILYEHLNGISESQASDERLWAGLCNGVFYEYVRTRWKYSTLKQGNPETDASTLKSRFFFSGSGRGSIFRNTLSKCWWAGQYTYDSMAGKKWNILDSIGPEDFSTKVSDIFYSNSFSANKGILKGIAKGLDFYRKQGIKLATRDHIRPTLQYLNALGGSILLDMYSEDEIAREVINNIEIVRTGKQSVFVEEELIQNLSDNVLEENAEETYIDEINVDYDAYEAQIAATVEEFDAATILGNPTEVMYGCWVEIKEILTGKILHPMIPKEEGVGTLFPLVKTMLGHKIGDIVTDKHNKKYEIVNIMWNNE